MHVSCVHTHDYTPGIFFIVYNWLALMEMVGVFLVPGLGWWGQGLALKCAKTRWHGKIASDLAFAPLGPRSATNCAYD